MSKNSSTRWEDSKIEKENNGTVHISYLNIKYRSDYDQEI